MRRAVTVLALLALLHPATVVGQEQQQYERGSLPPVTGYTTDDGVIVLDDREFCSYILGSIFGRGEYISTNGIFFEGKRPQDVKKMIRRAALTPATNGLALDICAEALNQFRLPQRDPVPMPDWSLDHIVIPEAFADLLAGGSNTGSPSSSAASTASTNAVVMEGTGSTSTAPFDLAAGDYEATIDLTDECGGDVGRLIAVLTRPDGYIVELIEQSAYIYGVEAGRHYWDITTLDAECVWTLTLALLSE